MPHLSPLVWFSIYVSLWLSIFFSVLALEKNEPAL